MEERDKYLTEAMGEHWHNFKDMSVFGDVDICCTDCDTFSTKNKTFSTWDGFGKLYEWSVEQDWWHEFLFEWSGEIISFSIPHKLVYPDAFANVIYEFLRDKETSSESSNISG